MRPQEAKHLENVLALESADPRDHAKARSSGEQYGPERRTRLVAAQPFHFFHHPAAHSVCNGVHHGAFR
jgi:hypothetical protein